MEREKLYRHLHSDRVKSVEFGRLLIARNITAIRDDELKKINAMGRTSENALVIYEGLFDKPTISIEAAAKKLDISAATSGRLLERLCEEGILSNLDNCTRNKVFIYKSYIDVFNKD